MAYLLDTCVVSDIERGDRHPTLRAWWTATAVDDIAVPVIALAEIRIGANKQRAQGLVADAERIDRWLRGVSLAFPIIPFDTRAALVWSDMTGVLPHDGTRSFERDIMIAATAIANGLTLATRNIRHFGPVADRFPDLVVFDPYQERFADVVTGAGMPSAA